MLVYRIAKLKYINDLSGEGPRIGGSRWTSVGTPVVYVAENRALAALEFYGHVKSSLVFPPLKLATIEIPANAAVRKVDIPNLPKYWKDYPPPDELQNIGTGWILSGEFILKVPSVQVPNEYNYILNATHPDIKKVVVISVEDFSYDLRLIKS
jgi:RES domain-containing protein